MSPYSANAARPPAAKSTPQPRNAIAPNSRPPAAPRRNSPARVAARPADAEPDKILFQSYFKSVGPRTYASQIKLLKNDNHMLVLTCGRPNPDGGEPIKTRLIVFAEDFTAFFRLLQETAQFIKGHPLPEDVRQRRQRFWQRQAQFATSPATGACR
jgi:hypothetical protein